MSAASPLPLSGDFSGAEEYVESLLLFISSCELFQRLCGGVHVLDFLTKEPDLYSTVLPQQWREWFQSHDISGILDLLMREDIAVLKSLARSSNDLLQNHNPRVKWRDGPCPPPSLLDYIQIIRKHSLVRGFEGESRRGHATDPSPASILPRHVAVGMKPKKIHEVQNFVKYIGDLVAEHDVLQSQAISHIIDFGSGQNYLGRALASPPYNKTVMALESKQHNITGAKDMDITAKLAEKEKIMRNKKQFRSGLKASDYRQMANSTMSITNVPCNMHNPPQDLIDEQKLNVDNGCIHYIETYINDGDLSKVVSQIKPSSYPQSNGIASDPQLMVISLHSCGNLIHHGLRSLTLNPSVRAVAMVGCCYNLVTERLGSPTYKLPSLRSSNLRLDQTSSANDPHGFPMSERFATYKHQHGEGIRLNITARMMACQAPQNWTATDCESFFTRHFYRALLQRIFLDRGIVEKPTEGGGTAGGSPRGWTGAGPALTIGSLRKACYTSFKAYVRGAIAKLAEDPERGAQIAESMKGLTNNEIERYEERYKDKKKELSIIWSLMAFSASVVESTIVVDRWLWLKEQEEVRDCWVEAVFDYKQSPRNLVIVGIKK